MAEAKQSKGRFRAWLDRRREAQRRSAEITDRMNAQRKADDGRKSPRDVVGGSGTPGPPGF
jgi:hypothetical protein